MELAEHQQRLLALLRSNGPPSRQDDPYFQQVAQSRDLEEARSNIFLWRVYVLERTCVLTTALLRQRGLLEPALKAFICTHNISPFREYQPLAFLASLAAHPDRLLVSVSQFELALMKVREGAAATYTIRWDVDPHTVLNSLAQDRPVLDSAADPHVIRVSAHLPHYFKIARAGDVP